MINQDSKKAPILRFKGLSDVWEQRKLGEVAQVIGGGTPSTKEKNYWGGKINWYTPAELGENIYLNKSKRTITSDGLKNSSTKILPIGTVLFTSRAVIGKTAILSTEATTNQGLQSIVPLNNKLNSYFLYLLTDKLKRYAESHSVGSTFSEISGKELAKASINLPTLLEQSKIVDLMKIIDNILALQQRKMEQLKTLKKGVQQQLVDYKSSNWLKYNFLNIIEKIIDFRGRTPQELNLKWSDQGYVVLSAQNVKHGYIDKEMSVHFGNEKLYKIWMHNENLYQGQVLLTTETPMGNVAQVPDNDKYILSQRVIALVPKKDIVTDDFLAFILSTPKIQNDLQRLATGGTIQGISQRSLKYLKITLPKSLKTQKYITDVITELNKNLVNLDLQINNYKQFRKFLLQNLFI